MKLIVYVGGPWNNRLEWLKEFPELVNPGDPEGSLYRFCFGDQYIGVYYWKADPFHANSLKLQVEALQIRHGDHPRLLAEEQ